jgi:hypothetical protein
LSPGEVTENLPPESHHNAIWSALHGRGVDRIRAFKRDNPPTKEEKEKVERLKELLKGKSQAAHCPRTRDEFKRLKEELAQFL